MGCMLTSPVELIRVQRRGSSDYRCAVAEMQGWRTGHEDAHAMRCDAEGGSFWVLDGHGGAHASAFCAPALLEAFALARGKDSGLVSQEAADSGFSAVDAKLRADCEGNQAKESGSTVVGALLAREPSAAAGAGTSSYAVQLLNCGDSRGILVRPPGEVRGQAGAELQVALPRHVEALTRSGTARKQGYIHAPTWPVICETVDHKPCHPTEKARIYAAGGTVSDEEPSRVDGNLAVSRGLGDFEYKSDRSRSEREQKVPCLPDVYTVRGVPAGSLCILACDGVWDVMSSEYVGNFFRDALGEDPTADLGVLCAELIRETQRRNSRDNVTVMAVQLADGSGWASEPDEIVNYSTYASQFSQKCMSDDETMTQSVKFLRRTGFIPEPRPCGSCEKWLPETFQCPCKTVFYCSRKCQKRGWKEHRMVCSVVAADGGEGP
eukprot:TRINITY_DN13985_c0_g1_i1.p2 TRINITY_DN13985_c0_g1~~TRINITY_DN13985_c0_g1_i1.p2  ORF type:complete len:436 (+),score=77.34 TRINITY_DN13985_c0_g1_i1:162-1469(+)